MNFRDWIVLICKAFLWILPCLLILAIVVMLVMNPGNAGVADTTGSLDAAVLQTGETSSEKEVADQTGAAEQTGIADKTDETVDNTAKDDSFEDNVQFGAIPGLDDGTLDDTVPVGSVPPQTGAESNTAGNANDVKVMDDRLDPLHPDFDITLLTYKDYTSMDADRQRAVVEAFSSPETFIAWYNAVKARYEAENPNIELGEDGMIDGKDFG